LGPTNDDFRDQARQIRVLVRKQPVIYVETDTFLKPMRHPLSGCRPLWQGKKQADFRRPQGFEWGRTAQGAGGCEFCHIPLGAWGGRSWGGPAGIAGKPSILPLALAGGRAPATLLPPRTPAHNPTPAIQGRFPGQQRSGWGLVRAVRTPQPVSCSHSAPLWRPGRLHSAPPNPPLPTWCWASTNAPTGGDRTPRGEGACRLRPLAQLTRRPSASRDYRHTDIFPSAVSSTHASWACVGCMRLLGWISGKWAQHQSDQRSSLATACNQHMPNRHELEGPIIKVWSSGKNLLKTRFGRPP